MMEFQEILYLGDGVGFLQTHSVHAVDVGHSFAALGRLRELSAVPDKGASAIGQRVAFLQKQRENLLIYFRSNQRMQPFQHFSDLGF